MKRVGVPLKTVQFKTKRERERNEEENKCLYHSTNIQTALNSIIFIL